LTQYIRLVFLFHWPLYSKSYWFERSPHLLCSIDTAHVFFGQVGTPQGLVSIVPVARWDLSLQAKTHRVGIARPAKHTNTEGWNYCGGKKTAWRGKKNLESLFKIVNHIWGSTSKAWTLDQLRQIHCLRMQCGSGSHTSLLICWGFLLVWERKKKKAMTTVCATRISAPRRKRKCECGKKGWQTKVNLKCL